MRILVISNLYPPRVLGGFERLCAAAVERWRASGSEVTVLTTRSTRAVGHPQPGVIPALPGDPLRIGAHGGPPAGRVGRLLWHAWSLREVRAALDASRPDVVALWGVVGLSRSAIVAALESGAPTVAVAFDYGLLAHLTPGPPPQRDGISAPLERALAPLRRSLRLRPALRLPTRWVFCSHAVRSEFERALGALGDAVVVHHGVDVPSERPPLRPRSGRLQVGAVGRLVADKGFHTLLAAVGELAEDDPQGAPSVEIRGPDQDPSYAARLRELAEHASRLGAEVRIGPAIAGEALHGWLVEKDCIAVLGEWPEPFSLMPLHAMAAGRPVVGTATGGAAELLDDSVNAIVVPPGDAHSVASSLRRLAHDPDLAERLASRAFAHVSSNHRRRDAEARLDAVMEPG